jgi:hypothetical protein
VKGAPTNQKHSGATSVARVLRSATYRAPGHLAEQIRISRDVFKRESKEATVLFADFEGSLELLTDSNP